MGGFHIFIKKKKHICAVFILVISITIIFYVESYDHENIFLIVFTIILKMDQFVCCSVIKSVNLYPITLRVKSYLKHLNYLTFYSHTTQRNKNFQN